ncbi:MAG: PAN domain-containing protein [Blastocatellia bacterium]
MNNPKRIHILTNLCAVAFLSLFSLIGIEATSVQNQSFERNVDRPGSDYRNFDLEPKGPGSLWGSDADCQLACKNDPKCQTWTYVKPGVQGPKARCWLKGVIPAARASDCCTSGVVTRAFEPNTDRPGNDYTSSDLESADPNACQTTCRNDPKCVTWTYVKPGVQGTKARCWLKNTVPAARTSDCCTSGVMERPIAIR